MVGILLPIQCRMARAALGWDIRELSVAARISVDAVARFERGEPPKHRTLEALRHALEAAGMEFVDSPRPGVRMKAAWYVERCHSRGRSAKRHVRLPAFRSVVALIHQSRARGEIVRIKAPDNASTDELDHLHKLGAQWL
jgi:transcriptional regulator with XRE-family HTH domain